MVYQNIMYLNNNHDFTHIHYPRCDFSGFVELIIGEVDSVHMDLQYISIRFRIVFLCLFYFVICW